MKTITRILVVLAFAGWVGDASAGPIGAADIVIVGGQEWAQVDLFTNNSWNTINGQCPAGACSPGSTINGYDLDGWTWASNDAVQALFDSFTGQLSSAPSAYSEVNSMWAPSFLSLFDSTNSNLGFEWVRGHSSTPNNSITGFIRSPYILDYSSPNGADIFNATASSSDGFADFRTGAWMVREVPAPATLILFGLGLASIRMNSRKRAAKI